MKAILTAAVAACALVVAGPAAATLVPSVYDPDHTGCVDSSYAHGVLHLAKNCATSTNAAAQADVTGLTAQSFSSATFTLASTAQCQGGSPRFNVVTTTGTYFLGCNNVAPSGSTYTFTAETLAAAGQQVPMPTGTIRSVQIVLDVQGSADLAQIAVNGVSQVPAPVVPTSKDACKHGGWRSFDHPSFRNQGQCVSWFNHHAKAHHKHH
jgi:hypothetical protein